MDDTIKSKSTPETMPHSNQIGMLKEQLRAKSLELKKKDVEKARQEDKILKVIEISKKKIFDLKQEMARVNDAKKAHDLKDPSSEEKDPKDLEVSPQPEGKLLKNLKLTEAVQKLKEENQALTRQITLEKLKQEQLAKEKTELLDKIQQLEGNSKEIPQLKEKISKIDEESKNSETNYKKILEEKDKLLAKYNQLLADERKKRQDERLAANAEQLPSKFTQDLKTKLDFLKTEKRKLELELSENKRLFNSKLTQKVKIIEAEGNKKAKVLRQQKNRINHFSEQVMDEGEGPAWIITYSDMATLLLTFFILYYSIAAQNLGKFKEAILEESDQNLGLIELLDISKIRASLQNLAGFESNNIVKDINSLTLDQSGLGISKDKSKIVVRIPGQTLFQPASAVLEKAGWPILEDTAKILKKYPGYKIHIQGHTDDTPIATEKFPTNWELSSTRATAVLRFLIDKGLDPNRLTATGYADTFPLSPNTTALGRAKNRRVEFVLEKNK